MGFFYFLFLFQVMIVVNKKERNILMRDVKYMESAADFPKHVSKTSQVLDEELLVDFIKNNKEIIQEVYVGMAEDWSCSNPYWTKNEGFGDRKYLVLKSIWATPTAEVIFTDGEMIRFACVKRKIKKMTFIQNLFSLVGGKSS